MSSALSASAADALNATGKHAEVVELLRDDVAREDGFAYVPPMARALVALGERARARAMVAWFKRSEEKWMVPRYMRAAARAAAEDLAGTVEELTAAHRDEQAG